MINAQYGAGADVAGASACTFFAKNCDDCARSEEVAKIAAEIAQHERFGLALTKQAFNFVEDARGKRQVMDSVFHMHHLAHAHNQLMTGNLVGGLDAKAMASANKKQAGEG